jgi:Rrf2 family cysteine metabolism transcriptional repressor
LRLMVDLADHEGNAPVILRDVAERQRISRRYLEQLATGLRNAHLISSVPGKNGGYSLQRAPDEILVGEIIDATIGPVDPIRCVRKPSLCVRAELCPSRKLWLKVKEGIDGVLRATTLADLRECAIAGKLEPSPQPTPCSSQ